MFLTKFEKLPHCYETNLDQAVPTQEDYAKDEQLVKVCPSFRPHQVGESGCDWSWYSIEYLLSIILDLCLYIQLLFYDNMIVITYYMIQLLSLHMFYASPPTYLTITISSVFL